MRRASVVVATMIVVAMAMVEPRAFAISTDHADNIAVNHVTNRIYVTDREDTVLVINGANHRTVAAISIEGWPDAVAVNTDTNRIYTANFQAGTVSVIDGTTSAIIATVPVEAEPQEIAVNSTTNRIYVAHFSTGYVTVIDGVSHSIIARIDVGDRTHGVAGKPGHQQDLRDRDRRPTRRGD